MGKKSEKIRELDDSLDFQIFSVDLKMLKQNLIIFNNNTFFPDRGSPDSLRANDVREKEKCMSSMQFIYDINLCEFALKKSFNYL